MSRLWMVLPGLSEESDCNGMPHPEQWNSIWELFGFNKESDEFSIFSFV